MAVKQMYYKNFLKIIKEDFLLHRRQKLIHKNGPS